MKRIIIYTIPLLLFALLSCNKEDTMLGTEGNIDSKTDLAKITITAYGAGYNNVSKTVIAGEDFKQVHWNANEKIAVFYNQTLNMFTSNNATVSGVSDFSGTIDGITDPAQLEGKEVIGLYPYNPNATIDASGVVTTTLPSYQVAVDDTFADNLFISMGKSTTDATKMYFYNVCSGVCFTVSHNDIKIVTLRGANDEMLAGDFSVKFATIEGQEIPQIQSIINGSNIITVEAPNGGTFIPGKRYYIVTLPQSLPSGLIIEGFKEDGTVYENTISRDITLKRSIFARKIEFDKGIDAQDLYTYYLSVNPPTEPFDYTGGTKTNGYSVTSYRTLKSDTSKRYPNAWKSQISDDGGTTWNDLTENNKSTYSAGWFTLGAYSDFPSTTFQSYDISCDRQEEGRLAEEPHTVALKAGIHASGIDNSSKANAIDLSMYDLLGNPISQTTANCYIVNAPGWYKFPMVYGNAIKNGATNTSSFTSSADQVLHPTMGETVLMNFVDHNGSNITQPWVTIAHSGGTYAISKAELVWQDEPNLVTNISIGNNGVDSDYIYFYIGKETIHQGNAVIAAYTGNIAAWSWHIWVTDENLASIPVKNLRGLTYDFLPINLGWCEYERLYENRTISLRIVQIIGTGSDELVIDQTGDLSTTYDNTFYQWGRKDPLIAVNKKYNNIAKTWYDSEGNSSIYRQYERIGSDANIGVNVIKQYIQNPLVHDLSHWGDGVYQNLWNINKNTASADYDHNIVVIKTIYDPSPIGYCVPPLNAFGGFANTELAYNDQTSYLNVSGSFAEGWNFKTNIGDGTIFFPITGQLLQSTANNASLRYPRNGYYWSADNRFYTGGLIFGFSASWVEYDFNNKSGDLTTIRPVQEK